MSVVAESPLPYLPIRIQGASPIRSSVGRPAAAPAQARRGGRRIAVAGLAVLAIAAIAAANVGAAPVGSGGSAGFRLAPGHALPVALDGATSGDGRSDFRLAPGHALPVSLSR